MKAIDREKLQAYIINLKLKKLESDYLEGKIKDTELCEEYVKSNENTHDLIEKWRSGG